MGRGIAQSQSTKVLLPNSHSLEKTKGATVTVLSQASENQKPDDLAAAHSKSKSITHMMALQVGPKQTSASNAELQSCGSSGQRVVSRKVLANQTNSQSSPYLESQTEAQDHAKSPAEKQSEELTQMKKLALITKNPSAMPLKTAKKLMGKDDATDGDLGENISSDPEGHIKLKSCESKPSITQGQMIYADGQQHRDLCQLGSGAAEQQPKPGAGAGGPKSPKTYEEDDFEDLMMPTDDEGPTSYTQTQKIPISLIKKQDKASVSLHSFLTVYA